MIFAKPFAKSLGSAWIRLKTWGPAGSFLGGFGWDLATLGRSIQPFDLFTLLAYWLGAAGLLWWMALRASKATVPAQASPSPPPGGGLRIWLGDSGPYFLLQFFFGGMFSALAIFYFKSAGGPGAFLLVLALAALLVGNEFLDDHYRRFTLTWTLFGVCGMLFLNFALPHVFKSIHPLWFFASTALAVAATWGLRRLSAGTPGRLWPTAVAGVALIALFLAKVIPPVPLVLKGLAIGREMEKSPAGYSVKIEKPPLWAPFRKSEKRLRHAGEPVYCVSSVFMPAGLEVRLFHNWTHWDPRREQWETLTRAGFTVRGGRRQGFRGYTFKQAVPPGKWRVAVESEDGRELGSTAFEVVPRDSGAVLEWRTVELP